MKWFYNVSKTRKYTFRNFVYLYFLFFVYLNSNFHVDHVDKCIHELIMDLYVTNGNWNTQSNILIAIRKITFLFWTVRKYQFKGYKPTWFLYSTNLDSIFSNWLNVIMNRKTFLPLWNLILAYNDQKMFFSFSIKFRLEMIYHFSKLDESTYYVR